mmetsp:Transcript_34767/g.81264  ORF Transcript_34767/g.81264 Transcript_34767/m.81264 type:complete len:517 (-) Transcript_34767:71-1621(-)|eukprot:CAMPEP_0180148646 /NCGR_PEP_ID=MMETSP0986-20121125/20124_1 /TAXON_ID=697907 /ORGANISM="non described non described, Strain CCMP2293" /LENGTH=516 /DNA_ID=CAMNT_0022094723 /DNA_START=109 /DNA_END=1659 /DNA_ORIENTATION=+
MFSFLQPKIKKFYDISEDRVLGAGQFAVVRHAIHKETKQEVAVKVIKKEMFKGQKEELRLKAEVDIMKSVHHPNCIKFYEMFDSRSKVYIVMELVTGGELFDRIVEKDHYNESEAANIFCQIMSALAYLHKNGIVHRDIKPENIIYQSREESSQVKLADFGLAAMLGAGTTQDTLKTLCGTPSYLAPEVIDGSNRGYGKTCDIWSTGVILYILLCGCPPFGQGVSMPVLFDRIKRGNYSFPDKHWSGVSDDAKDIVMRMLTVDPVARITAEGTLQHEWVKRFQAKDLSKVQLGGLDRLKEWNVMRKLKGAANMVQSLHRWSSDTDPFEFPDPEEQKEIILKIKADPQRYVELRDAFNALDYSKSGTIDIADIQTAFQKHGMLATSQQAAEMLAKFDVKSTGKVDFEEYCICMGPGHYSHDQHLSRAEIKEKFKADMKTIFNYFDEEKNGVISARELKSAMTRLGVPISDAEIQKIVSLADTHKSGNIDFEEFEAAMLRHFALESTEDFTEDLEMAS